MEQEKQYVFDKPANVRRVLGVFFVACAGLLLLDFVHHRHVIHEWENLWGFYAVFGFVACVLLVLGAKEMRKAVMRDEDYYEGEADDDR